MPGLRRTADDADDDVDIFNRAINLEDEDSDLEYEGHYTEEASTVIDTNRIISPQADPNYALLIVPPQLSGGFPSTSYQPGQIRLLKRETNNLGTNVLIKQPAAASSSKPGGSFEGSTSQGSHRVQEQEQYVPPNYRYEQQTKQQNVSENTEISTQQHQEQTMEEHGHKKPSYHRNHFYRQNRSYNRGNQRLSNNHRGNDGNKRTDRFQEKQQNQQQAFYFQHERRNSEPDEEKHSSRQFVLHADEEEEKLSRTQKNQLWSQCRLNKEKWSHDGYEQLNQADANKANENKENNMKPNGKHYKPHHRRGRGGMYRYTRHDMR